ncbi:MAG: RNase adapter RapZ [Thermodesulfobacteriota bacterium]
MREEEKQLLVVTGLSGAGKSIALNTFEDMGFFCVDNLPLWLGDDFVRRLGEKAAGMARVALVVDSRSPDFFQEWPAFLALFKGLDYRLSHIFLWAGEQVLLRRFGQMRRVHPLAGRTGGVRQAIDLEVSHSGELRAAADLVIDTSSLAPNELRALLLRHFGSAEEKAAALPVRVVSFGFKRGLVEEADLVFDVRFLPNPYFQPDLKPLTGLVPQVADFVLANEDADAFCDYLKPLLTFLRARYQAAGKVVLTIAIGCTGGKHRSVALAERVAGWFGPEQVRLSHRDIGLE